MAKAKELYISLRDDPDLNIPEGDTRESAAWSEMSHRMRQHQSNAKALSMAVAPRKKESIDELLKFLDFNPFMDKNSLEYIMLYKAETAVDKVWKNIQSGKNPYKVTINGEERTINHGIHTGSSAPEEGHTFGTDSLEHKFREEWLKKLNEIHQTKESKLSDEDKIEQMKNLRQDFWQAREDHDDIQHDIWTNTEGKFGRERPPESAKNEHGVSHDLHDHVSEWFNELRQRHGANINDASSSFSNLASSLGFRVANKELTKDDLKNIQEHFANHPSDFNHLRNDWKDDDGSSRWNSDLYNEYNEHTQSTGDGGSDDDPGDPEDPEDNNDNNDDDPSPPPPDDEQEQREAAVEELINKHEDRIREEYEKVYGTDNEDHTFEEYKSEMAESAAKSDKAFGTFKKNRAKAAHKWNITQEANKKAEEKKERDAKVKDLQDRAAGSKDLKMSKREAEALIDEHGDADTAFDAHEKAFEDKTKKQKSANELPYTTDDLSKKIFGDVDPTSRLTHLSEDRKKNKFGDVSTSLARELIAHYKTHAGVMDAKTEKELVEQLAFLKDPSKRFPNMRIPKGETIGADIKAANDMVNEAQEKGYDLNGPEAGRLYEKREAERTRRVQHHQTSHVNPDSKEKKEASHGEGADASDPDDRKGVFSETDNTSFLHFDEDGNVTGRKRFHPSGGEHHENFKDDGSDDHHHRGDHEARGSRVKEHIVPSHGSNLTNKEKASVESLREAHKAKATAERSGDEAASAKADEDIAQHTKDLTAGDMGLKESDFLHDEGDEPKVGPPDPQVAAHMRAQGLEWNEGIRHWVAKEGHDERTKAAGSAFSHVGDGASMNIYTAEVGADGQINQSHASGSFVHTNNGQYHAVDPTHDSIPSSHAGVQAQKLGQIGSIQDAAAEASKSGNTQMVAARDHGHLTAHGASSAPKKDIFDRVGGAAKGAASFAGRLIRLKKLVEEESDNLSSMQLLQLHLALQKLEGKSKTVV